MHVLLGLLLMQCVIAKNVTLTTDLEDQWIREARVKNLWPGGVTTPSNKWDLIVNYDDDEWGLWVSMDNSWGYHSTLPSQLLVTIHGNSVSTPDCDMLISFTDGSDTKYFTMVVRLDGNGVTYMGPGCDTNLQNPSQPIFTGDVYGTMREEKDNYPVGRACRPAYIDPSHTCEYANMGPASNESHWPFTFTINNYPSENRMTVTLEGNEFAPISCGFNEYIPVNSGHSIYITGQSTDDNYEISSIYLQYQLLKTFAPTTTEPTTSPITFEPTSSPTKIPTNNPTLSPSKIPTTSPTTNEPSVHPTTIGPTISPSKTPTNNPTTNNPTITPSKTPTIIPTNMPSTSQPTTVIPTTNEPSIQPTTSIPSTAQPTPLIPTTAIPTTSVPTTDIPTTINPTTNMPSNHPTTNIPTTDMPTTIEPTLNPVSPTTYNPTTIPTTREPSNIPSITPTSATTGTPTKKPTNEGEHHDVESTFSGTDQDPNKLIVGNDSGLGVTSVVMISIISVLILILLCCVLMCVKKLKYFLHLRSKYGEESKPMIIHHGSMHYNNNNINEGQSIPIINTRPEGGSHAMPMNKNEPGLENDENKDDEDVMDGIEETQLMDNISDDTPGNLPKPPARKLSPDKYKQNQNDVFIDAIVKQAQPPQIELHQVKMQQINNNNEGNDDIDNNNDNNDEDIEYYNGDMIISGDETKDGIEKKLNEEDDYDEGKSTWKSMKNVINENQELDINDVKHMKNKMEKYNQKMNGKKESDDSGHHSGSSYIIHGSETDTKK